MVFKVEEPLEVFPRGPGEVAHDVTTRLVPSTTPAVPVQVGSDSRHQTPHAPSVQPSRSTDDIRSGPSDILFGPGSQLGTGTCRCQTLQDGSTFTGPVHTCTPSAYPDVHESPPRRMSGPDHHLPQRRSTSCPDRSSTPALPKSSGSDISWTLRVPRPGTVGLPTSLLP